MTYFANPYASNQQERKRVLERVGHDDWIVYAEHYEGVDRVRQQLGQVRRFSSKQWVGYDNVGAIIEAPPPARAGYFPSRARAARAVWDRFFHGAYYAANQRVDWPLHGARDQEELFAIVRALYDERGDYSAVARKMRIPRSVVAEVGRNYQSLWLRP